MATIDCIDDSILKDVISDWDAFLQTKTTDNEISLIQKHERTGRPLGEDGFIEKLERVLGRRLKKGRPGPKARVKKQN